MLEPQERPPIAAAPLSMILVVPPGAPAARDVLAAWVTFLNELGREYEILLIPERGPGAAPAAVEALATSYSRVRPLPAPGAAGFGPALQVGLDAARHPLVGYTTCDGSYKPSDLKQLLKWIDQVDLVTGYRVSPQGARRRRDDLLTRLVARFGFGVRLRDVGCLFVLARRSVFARIPVQSDGVFAHVEVLAKANFLGCLLTEAPVSWQAGAATAGPDDGRHGSTLADARRLFSQPDFGPAVLSPEQLRKWGVATPS